MNAEVFLLTMESNPLQWRHMSIMTCQITAISTVCTSKLRITVSLWGKPPVTAGFPSERTVNAESVSWCHRKLEATRTVLHYPILHCSSGMHLTHDDVINWKHFPRYWPFVWEIHRSPVNSPHKGQWRGALMFSLICVWINGWVNNREAGDLRRYRAHYHATVMIPSNIVRQGCI